MVHGSGITRKRGDEAYPGFNSLKREGLQLAQNVSGNLWTDYNLHDPGVTILEQLCYALTDLIYRADFPVEDFLTGEDGIIDFKSQALHLSEHIFPCRPMTLMDYRKIFLDALPQVGAVWLRPLTGNGYGGLFHITIKLVDDVSEQNLEGLLDMIPRVYRCHRNLGEDLHSITILPRVDCEVVAEIRIVGEGDTDHVVADVYAQCARYIAREPQVSSFDEVVKEEGRLENIFRGPLTKHGVVKDGELEDSLDDILLDPDNHESAQELLQTLAAHLFSVVKGVKGVEYVVALSLQPKWGRSHKGNIFDAPRSALRLHIPRHAQEVKIRVMKNGRALPLSLDRIRVRYDAVTFKEQSLRHTLQNVSTREQTPRGEFRHFQHYVSIQHQFPNLYGINAYGVPASASPEAKARSIQLKTYLLLFEQIMANFTATLQNLPRLFSPKVEKQSYFFQSLEHPLIPGIDSVYRDSPSQILHAIFGEGYDANTCADRKNRLLDYLLALYGEKFSQSSLRHFNFYYGVHELEEVMINNKVTFLQCLTELSQHRASGFNYEEASWNTTNVSSLKKKVSILLGFKYVNTRSLTDVFIEQGLELISDDQLTQIKEGSVAMELVDLGDIDDRTNQRFQELPTDWRGGKETNQLFQEILFLKNNVVNDSMIRYGIYPDRYRVGSTGNDELFQVVFRPHEEARWEYLASYRTKEEAVGSVNDLRRLLINLNVESEGVHLVEHILLRPESRETHPSDVPEDFYSFRLSVMFPSWTARCADADFRKLAEETVHLNCPAHMYPECYWLNFETMRTFERLYRMWLEGKSRVGGDEHLQDTERALTKFLVNIRSA